MANSDPISPSRSETLVGDVAYRRAVSEGLLTKVGAQSNFVNKYQTDIKEWKLNGEYKIAVGISFYDGIAAFFYNSEITGIFHYNGVAGSSGTTEFDILWKNASGVTQGSIFSTTPKINSGAAADSIGFKNLVTGVSSGGTGITLPVFSKTTFLQGESVFFKLNSSMVGPINCGVTIFYRPIN